MNIFKIIVVCNLKYNIFQINKSHSYKIIFIIVYILKHDQNSINGAMMTAVAN